MQQSLTSWYFMLQSWLQDSNSVLCGGVKYDIIKYRSCASDIQVREKHNKLCSNERCDQSFCWFQKLHYGCSVLQCHFFLLQAPPKHWTVALQPVRYMPVHTTTSKYPDPPLHLFIYLLEDLSNKITASLPADFVPGMCWPQLVKYNYWLTWSFLWGYNRVQITELWPNIHNIYMPTLQ